MKLDKREVEIEYFVTLRAINRMKYVLIQLDINIPKIVTLFLNEFTSNFEFDKIIDSNLAVNFERELSKYNESGYPERLFLFLLLTILDFIDFFHIKI